MRLSRSFLLLAAGLTAAARAADISVTTDTTLSSTTQLAGNNFKIGGNVFLTVDIRNSLNSPIDTTFSGQFKDDLTGASATSVIIKTGGGTLQYDGFSDDVTQPGNITYFKNYSYLSFNPFEVPVDLRLLANNPTGQDASKAGAAFAGIINVQQGQLQVSGHVNQWADYGNFNAQFNLNNAQMIGASAVIVGSGAKLSFQNTRLNLVNANADLAGPVANLPATPLVARLNFVNNLVAATTSEVEVGKTSDYILVAHADFATAGLGAGTSTLGVLSGKGRFYKTGPDAMEITGNATFDGEVVLAGGNVTLASANGDTLWLPKSVNLASSSAAQGTDVPFLTDTTGAAGRWKPGYAPGAQAGSLVVSGDQRIRNLQSLYGETGVYQPILPGTGGGSTVEITKSTDILRVTQETGYDGYYTGNIDGLGTFQKNGTGALALFSSGNNIANIDIQEGKIISNVQSLGSGTVNIGANGQLSIVQWDTGPLRALIVASSTLAELRFKSVDNIYYRGSSTATVLGKADAGVADITRAQPNFYGKVIVENGNRIVFSPEANNAFLNASGVELLTGPSSRETSISFNDTNQIVNNLTGDANTRINLGRGNITLGITAASTYLGGISGVGNLVKGGAATFTLGGANTYFGASIVQQGTLAVSAANGVSNTSGVILAASATTFSGTGAQSVGALFGRAGTTLSAGGLTVGLSADLRGRLNTELGNLPPTVTPPTAAYYLATETTDTVTGFSPVTTLTLLVQQYNLNDTITVDGVTDAAEALAYLDSVTVDGVVDTAEVKAHRDLLGFAGTLNLGSGGLTKLGVERLILSGTANYTGLTDVQEGILEVSAGTLVGTSGINIAAGAQFVYNAGSANATYTTPLTGSGTFQKLGTGRLDLDGAGSAFTGDYDVVGGTLAVTFSPSTPGGSVTNQGSVDLTAGSTFIAKVATNLDWSGEVYGTGTFVKTGAGVLTLTTGTIFHDGLTDVLQGGLVVSAITAGDLHLAAGTTFVDNVADDPLSATEDYFTANLTGPGTFTKTGAGDLRIENAQAGFTGSLILDAGSLTLVSANAFSAAADVDLRDGSNLVLLNGAAQTLTNINASSGSTITADVAGTDLTLSVGTGATRNFLGRIIGNPDLIKTGAGKLYLDRPVATPNALGSIAIQAGELEASQAGLGGAAVDIAAGATLRFFADTGVTDTYTIAITGTGAIAKSGAGTVDLTGASLVAASTTIDVAAGTLILSETALGAGRAPVVTLANGATFEYQATANAAFGVANFAGTGNVAFGRTGVATPTITLSPNGSGTTGYTGLTTVRDGVTLVLGAGFTGIGGINAEAGSTLDLSAIAALTITQAVDGTLAGNLVGTANLTLAGTATLTVESNGGTLNGYAGTVTVSGATLALDLANTKGVTLAAGGTLSLRGAGTNYTGPIAGSGNVVLEDGVDIDLTLPGAAAATSLGSAAITRLTLADGSHLTANLTAGSVVGATPFQLNGGLLTVTGSGPVTLNLAPLAATPATPTGAAGLELLGTAAYTVTGSVLGDLAVAAGATVTLQGASISGDLAIAGSLSLGSAGNPVALGGDVDVSVGGTLSGSWSIAGTLTNDGTVAPGHSPAHVTAAGIDNSGTLTMEVTATTEDQIAFTDSAILNRNGTGRLEVNRYGTGNSYGVRHVIFKDTVSPGAGSYVSALAEDPRFATVVSVGTSTTALRHLLVYPTQLQGGPDHVLGNADDTQDPLRSLAVDGEIAVYQVRAAADYTHPTAPANVLAWLRTITEVTLTETAPGEWTSALGTGFTALGARFATLGDAQLTQAIDNLSALGQYSLATVAIAGMRADQDAVARRLELNRFDKAGTSVKKDQWYFDVTGGRTTVDLGPTASITGANAGFIRDLGFDGYAGLSFGIDKSKGRYDQASVDTSGFRLGAFGGFLSDDRRFSLDAGLSIAALSGDLTHPSAFGSSNSGSAKARTTAGWVRAASALGLGEGWALTPFAQFEASSTKLSGLSETGQSDALTVKDATLTESTFSIGVGIQDSWVSSGGAWRYRLSLDIAYFSQISGDSMSLTSGIPTDGLAFYSADRRVLPGSGFSLAPTLTFGPDPDSTFTLGLRFDQAADGNAVSGQFGYRKRF